MTRPRRQPRRTTGAYRSHLVSRLPSAPGPSPPPGPRSLLVHGLASNARLWDGVATRLAGRGHPVAAVDQRGHGQSDKPDSGYDFATLTEDLAAVLAALDWPDDRTPLAAGQSWGANVVLELAIRHPGAVGGLVLVDGGTMDLADRFADWPTCEAALAPPPLLGTKAVDFEAMIRLHHPDWPEEGITARWPTSRCCRTALSGRGSPGNIT